MLITAPRYDITFRADSWRNRKKKKSGKKKTEGKEKGGAKKKKKAPVGETNIKRAEYPGESAPGLAFHRGPVSNFIADITTGYKVTYVRIPSPAAMRAILRRTLCRSRIFMYCARDATAAAAAGS